MRPILKCDVGGHVPPTFTFGDAPLGAFALTASSRLSGATVRPSTTTSRCAGWLSIRLQDSGRLLISAYRWSGYQLSTSVKRCALQLPGLAEVSSGVTNRLAPPRIRLKGFETRRCKGRSRADKNCTRVINHRLKHVAQPRSWRAKLHR